MFFLFCFTFFFSKCLNTFVFAFAVLFFFFYARGKHVKQACVFFFSSFYSFFPFCYRSILLFFVCVCVEAAFYFCVISNSLWFVLDVFFLFFFRTRLIWNHSRLLGCSLINIYKYIFFSSSSFLIATTRLFRNSCSCSDKQPRKASLKQRK